MSSLHRGRRAAGPPKPPPQGEANELPVAAGPSHSPTSHLRGARRAPRNHSHIPHQPLSGRRHRIDLGMLRFQVHACPRQLQTIAVQFYQSLPSSYTTPRLLQRFWHRPSASTSPRTRWARYTEGCSRLPAHLADPYRGEAVGGTGMFAGLDGRYPAERVIALAAGTLDSLAGVPCGWEGHTKTGF